MPAARMTPTPLPDFTKAPGCQKIGIGVIRIPPQSSIQNSLTTTTTSSSTDPRRMGWLHRSQQALCGGRHCPRRESHRRCCLSPLPQSRHSTICFEYFGEIHPIPQGERRIKSFRGGHCLWQLWRRGLEWEGELRRLGRQGLGEKSAAKQSNLILNATSSFRFCCYKWKIPCGERFCSLGF